MMDDEIYFENGLLKKRSEEYRLRCIKQTDKIKVLQERIKKQDAFLRKQEERNTDVLQDLQAQLNGAIQVITQQKEMLETSQKDRMRLLQEHNERLAEIQILKDTLFRTGMFYDQCLVDLKKKTEENDRLRFVNVKLMEALREKDKD
jgi:hypothetical protein